MKTVWKGKPRVLFAAVLASVLYCCAAQAADKTITAHIVLDSQLGTTTIDDDGEADARVVIDAMQDSPDTNEQGATWSYSWSHVATEYRNSPAPTPWGQGAILATVPNIDAPTNTISTNFDMAGYYRVQFQVSIEFKPVTGDDVWKGVATAEASQIVIGGDFTETGTNLLRYYCGASTDTSAHVSAPLQPVGTTWAWTTSASLSFEENEATPQPDGTITTVAGTPVMPGNRYLSVGSEWIQIIYSLNGVTWSSAMHNGYTVFKPTKIKRLAIQHGGDFNAEGKPFYLSKIWYAAEDQYGDGLAHVPVNELFGAFNSSTTHPTENWAAPDAKGGTADADGIFPDDIFVIDTLGTLNPTPQIPVQGQLTQELVQSGQQKYYLGSSNPGKGCLMQTGTLKYYIDHADHE